MKRVRAAWVVASVALILMVVVVVTAILLAATTITKVRGSQVTNTDTINNTAETLKIIRDCTQPEGECYQRSQESTAEVVDNIGLLATYASACADEPGQQTVREIRECVLDKINRSRPKR